MALRLALQNINGFGLDKDRVKEKQSYTFLKDKEVNMMELAESNICWSKIGQK